MVARLFIAMDLPEAIRAQLAALAIDLPGVRWVPAHQLHLTLRFLGDVADGSPRQALEAALAQIVGPPLSVSLRGVGQFPERGRPRVLWAGLTPVEPVFALAARVEAATAAAGFAPEPRPFSPHVTLARLKDPPPRRDAEEAMPPSSPSSRARMGARGFLAAHAGLDSPPFTVDEVRLYSSVLGSRGATHRVELRVPLRS